MDWEEARAIWQRITEACGEDPQLQHFRTDLSRMAVRYAHIRAEWHLGPKERRDGMAAERTGAHNVLIDACNILSRQLRAAGRDNAWRAALGDDRLRIGDFACYLHCMFGLRAR